MNRSYALAAIALVFGIIVAVFLMRDSDDNVIPMPQVISSGINAPSEVRSSEKLVVSGTIKFSDGSLMEGKSVGVILEKDGNPPIIINSVAAELKRIDDNTLVYSASFDGLSRGKMRVHTLWVHTRCGETFVDVR